MVELRFILLCHFFSAFSCLSCSCSHPLSAFTRCQAQPSMGQICNIPKGRHRCALLLFPTPAAACPSPQSACCHYFCLRFARPSSKLGSSLCNAFCSSAMARPCSSGIQLPNKYQHHIPTNRLTRVSSTDISTSESLLLRHHVFLS